MASSRNIDPGGNPLFEEYLARMGLNERQRRALSYVLERGEITNSALQKLASVSRRTAAYDLSHLVKNGILELQGTRKAARYVLNPVRHQRTPENNSGDCYE